MTPPDPKSLIAEGERLLVRVVPEDDTYGTRQEAFEEWASLNASDLLALAKVGLAAQERPDNARVAELRHQAKHAVMVGASMLGEALADADEQRKRADTLEAALGLLGSHLGAIKREGRAEAFDKAATMGRTPEFAQMFRALAAKEREA